MEEFHSYKIKKISNLGQGAFGRVEKIELFNSMGSSCGFFARKLLEPNSNILRNVLYEEIKRRFIREVIYQSKCHHTNIIQIFLFNRYTEVPYFVMEFGQKDLHSEIIEGNLSDQKKIKIMLMLLNAVKKIHDEGYLHRDIKPTNVIKFNEDLYKLSDFGLVKNIDAENCTTVITELGQQMGTYRYMAPEIIVDGEYTEKTDIYALGILFNDLKLQESSLTPIIEKCKKPDKESRYGSIDDILSDMVSIHLL